MNRTNSIFQRWMLAAGLAAWALTPTSATAQGSWSDSLYLSLGGLYLLPAESSYTYRDDEVTSKGTLELDPGMGFLVAAGAGNDVGLRGELELGYRKMDWDKAKVEGGETIDTEGDYTSLSVMANGIWAFEASDWMRPYLGIGVGLARHTATDDETDEDGTATAFAYQGMLGVGFPLSDQTEARVGYRYFATADAEFDEDFDGYEASYTTHSIEAGIRFRF